ncbi:DUF1566 domain-containing protein [Crocinitomicaceae bacterium]|nr:DUF1566 domain-containing protein [Crocinitomicaceae bacterium]
MKRINLICLFVLAILTTGHNQVPPNAFNYSGVARDAQGLPLAITTIGIQISIIQSSATGTPVYVENHFVNTDEFGMFNLVVGSGSIQNGAMNSIAWNTDDFYLKVGMDSNGGTNFLTMGTTQLLSVPYALHAATADSVLNGLNENDPIFSNSVASSITESDTIQWNTFVDSTDISSMGYVAGPHTDSTDISSMGYVAGPDADSTDISTMGYVAGPHTDSTDISTMGYVVGPHTDSTDISNMGFITSNSIGFVHYIGEHYGGGIVFSVWKDSLNVEHGLIVDIEDLSDSPWSNVITEVGLLSNWDGAYNSIAIINQVGHVNSAASLCANSTSGGFNDWYLPSLNDVESMYNNFGIISRSLSLIPGASAIQISLSSTTQYWTSTEKITTSALADEAVSFDFNSGASLNVGALKTQSKKVRAIREF